MKIRVEIDTTPQELRSFFGLPDLETVNREWVDRLRDKLAAGLEGLDPAHLAALHPAVVQQMKLFEAMQKGFWDAFAAPREQK